MYFEPMNGEEQTKTNSKASVYLQLSLISCEELMRADAIIIIAR